MPVFSRRNGYNTDGIQLESASDTLKRRIIAAFYRKEYDTEDRLIWSGYTNSVEDVMIEMGVLYEFPENQFCKQANFKALKDYILDSNKWYIIFDFIEKYLAISEDNKAKEMTKVFNRILEEEVTAYRILDGHVIPITTKSELLTIEEAKKVPIESVKIHIGKALSLFSDRKAPDYENSIKESISAVESMCCIITGLEGTNATLGKTLKKLKDNGIYIHPAMENAFSSLYGYTSDESGIRHGGIDFANAPSEDAKYMLVSCSAFINYLLEKWRKIK